jgi:Reverse transcriptase (RNA-dependent DNA polymerase)
MVFNTRYGLFEILVIPFGLSNTLVIFQVWINEILYLYLNVFCTVYINDILVYLDNPLEYKEYIKKVLYVLQDTSFQLDIKKYKFEIIEIIYLGLILFTKNIRINPTKIKYIID